MSDAPKRPRVILEEAEPAPRLDFEWEQAVVPVTAKPPAGRWSGLGRAAAGAALLAVGLAALDAANFVADQFARGPVQGWATLGVVVAGFGLLASGGWREVRGLLSIRAVERARAAFARGDLDVGPGGGTALGRRGGRGGLGPTRAPPGRQHRGIAARCWKAARCARWMPRRRRSAASRRCRPSR